MNDLKKAAEIHKNVPPDWYFSSMRTNFCQNFWHRTRIEHIKNLIKYRKNCKVLDIGCADGMFTEVIANSTGAKEIIGIDALETSIKWAKKHFKSDKRFKFEVADIHRLKYKNESFDFVFALEVLEHVLKPNDALLEIKRVLKIGGEGIFLVPTDTLLFRFIWFFWTKFFKGKIWDDCHLQSYRSNLLVKMCTDAGFDIVNEDRFLLGMLVSVKVKKLKK